jgi:RNA ligase
MPTLHKYPRTHHLEGSRLQPGDEDSQSVPFAALAGRYLVIEEKLDGGNAGISFDAAGRLWLQSRGHFLTGGAREKHFDLFKRWAATHAGALRAALGPRFVLYGEWLYAKHTVFYDRLPHYFLEFDVLDAETGAFLGTEERRALLNGTPVVSVAVLRTGACHNLTEINSLLGPSLYKSPVWRENVCVAAQARGLDPEQTWKETDPSDLMEGLYLKVEEGGRVVERYKFIRASFLTTVLDSGSHWLRRPILPNQLRPGVDLFGGGA